MSLTNYTGSTMSSAEILALIKTWEDLTQTRRINLASAFNVVTDICKPDAVVMDCAFFNERLFRRSPAVMGLTAKRFSAVTSYLRDILRRLGRHAPNQRGADTMPPAWKALYDRLSTFRQLSLIGFIRFCVLEGIAPEAVTMDTLADFEVWCRTRIICSDAPAHARRTASNWNWAAQNVPGWPAVRLIRPRMRDPYTLPFDCYPASFQQDLASFLNGIAEAEDEDFFAENIFTDGISRSHRSHRGLRPRTITTREFQIRQAAAALVLGGHAPESLTSLRDLVHPLERARTVIAFFRERANRRQTSQQAGIADVLRQIARYHCRLPEQEVARITEWKRKVTPRQQTTMSPKNARRLRVMMLPDKRAMLLHYPAELLTQAIIPRPEPQRSMKPEDAARLVLYGVAMSILLICPMRRANLAALRLDEHLHRPDRRGLITHVYVSSDDVKNSEPIQWPIPPETGRLIETYLRHHRPHLAEPGNPFLFPGAGQRHRAAHDMAVALTEKVEGDIGVEFNMHIMRHFAVCNFLRRNPGQYALVARVLGDKVETVRAFYAGLETDAAAAILNASLQQDRKETRLLAARAFGRGRGRPPSPGVGGHVT